MGELLLCNEQIAAMPYYIEGIALNIYSMEELCYYIANNIYLLDSEFMSEELCRWIEDELALHTLSETLRETIHSQGSLSVFVEQILKSSFYLSEYQIGEILTSLAQMEEKSEFECEKIRADRLFEKDKYVSSIYAYRHLLRHSESEDPVLIGNIYHNLATAHARLFLFSDACRYYAKAFDLNNNQESLKELLYAYRCLRDDHSFMVTAANHGLEDREIQEIKTNVSKFSRDESIVAFESKLSEFTVQINGGNRQEFSEYVSRLLRDWKDEYRTVCRV